MAYYRGRGRRGRKSYGRRRVYRKRVYRKSRAPGQLSFPPLGRTQACNHVYSATISVNSSSGSIADHVFSANGMYDPDLTGVGRQPLGFDQLNEMYDYFTVTGSKIRIETAGNQTVPFYIGVCLRNTAASFSTIDPDTMWESPGIKKILVEPTAGARHVSMTFSAKKFFTNKSLLSTPELAGNSGSNPTDGAFFHILIAPLDKSSELSAQYINVKTYFHAVWTKPAQISSS